jgi:hypothetical protein
MLDPVADFHGWHYLRHNQRRQEHLASLGLPLARRSVLEVGAGIGDHTSFFLDRGCRVVTTEARSENLELLRSRHPALDVRQLDLDNPGGMDQTEVVYCYGTLYHLARPADAIAFLAAHTADLMLVETAVTPGDSQHLYAISEQAELPSQSVSGRGCRPTRPWVKTQLRVHFPHVYVTTTQPWHEEFPLDWNLDVDHERLTRAVFVASRNPLPGLPLTETIPQRQIRH